MLLDKDIREPLFDFLEDTFGKIRIIEEKTIGKSRADVVMVTPTALYGLEIKSDADTYARLAGQVKDYDKYYDFNFVVVGTSHATHIYEHVPEHWGVITVEEVDAKPDFYILREPMPNPKVKWKKKLEMLWRPELATIQELNKMPKYKEKKKAFVVDKIIERIDNGKIDANDLAVQVSEVLFERDYNTIKEDLAEYKRSEMAKKLEAANDPDTQAKLQRKREQARINFGNNGRRRRRKRSVGRK